MVSTFNQQATCFVFFTICFFAVNCLDRHVQHIPDKVALIWEKDEPGTEEKITYRYDMFLLLGFKIICAEFGKVI